jgi:hypothetical protein
MIVKELNELFSSENLGYELTDKVEEVVFEPVYEYPFFGQDREVIEVIAYPEIIRKDEQSIHATIIKPALTLLANPKFKTANQEYLDALEDYRKGDYGDCLTKCGSAFESVMKIICDSKGWNYMQTGTASVLISTILKNTNLDLFFDQPLLIIATLRNKLSKSHGAGTRPKSVSQNIAQYALN